MGIISNQVNYKETDLRQKNNDNFEEIVNFVGFPRRLFFRTLGLCEIISPKLVHSPPDLRVQ